jgi:hypothetical protein
MNKKNIKIILYVIVILAFYAIIMLLIFKNNINSNNSNNSNSNNNNNNSSTTAKNYYGVIGDNSIWKYNSGNWYKATENEVQGNKMDVFVNGNYFGNYKLMKGTTWNLFDDDNNYIDYEGDFIAFSKDLNVKIESFDIRQINVLELNEINNTFGRTFDMNSFSTNEVIEKDLDFDGLNDKIINLSNLDLDNQKEYFNIIYIKQNNNKIIIIKDNISVKDKLISPRYNLKYIINYNSLNNDSIIIQKSYFSNAGETSDMLLNLINNKYEIAIN